MTEPGPNLPATNHAPALPAADGRVLTTRLDRWTGPLMFAVSLGFLALIAGMVSTSAIASSLGLALGHTPAAAQPRAAPDHGSPPSPTGLLWETPDGDAAEHEVQLVLNHLWVLLALYPLYFGELLAHAWSGARGWRWHVVYCLFPPLRLGGRDHADGRSIWLPGLGWVRIDRALRTRVEKAFSVPMLVIALLVLPLLGVEYYYRARSMGPSWQMLVFLQTVEGLIWLAFTIEFIIMLAIVARRGRYCREHWIDLLIICLPLIGFLRLLRLGRALRLYELVRLGRAYRARRLGARLFRSVLLLNAIRRLAPGHPEQRLAALREELEEKEAELEALRREIGQLEEVVAQNRAAAQRDHQAANP